MIITLTVHFGHALPFVFPTEHVSQAIEFYRSTEERFGTSATIRITNENGKSLTLDDLYRMT